MADTVPLFDQLLDLQKQKHIPPVAQWQPERAGPIDIQIQRDGTWYHEGRPIQRQNMVKLFASVLRKDVDGYCLVTPVERLYIKVEEVPFIAVDMEVRGSGVASEILFITNVDDYVKADAGHPIWVEEINDGPRPYVRVRDGLDALMTRALFYRLVELATDEDQELVVYSCNQRFSLGRY